MKLVLYVTLDHKTSHKGHFLEIEIYTSSFHHFWPRYNYLKIWNLRVQKKSKYRENRL